MDILIRPNKLSGTLRAISSKSDMHRALIGAALAKGVSRIGFSTLSEDIKATIDVLSAMGAKIDLSGSDGEYSVSVTGIEKMPENALLDANECGTTARILLAVAAAMSDSFTMTGKNGLCKRPFKDLCECMAENGTKTSDVFLPITTSGKLQSGIYTIRGDVSSQYISGLFFALPLLDGDSEIRITSELASAGYIDMTLRTLCRYKVDIEKTDYGFFVKGNQCYTPVEEYISEGDWSNSLFWLAADVLGGSVTVTGLNKNSLQRDRMAYDILEKITASDKSIKSTSFDGEDIPDALPILATVLSLAKGTSVITGGSRLKIKESDRIASTTAMLKTLGADITATDDGFIINGVESFTGGTVDAANDHRIAMCAAIASQRASGDVIIRGAECVNKSYPTFFEDFEKLGGKYSVIHG